MRVEELEKYGIEKRYIERLIKSGIKELFPPQEEAIKKGLLEGKNIVLSVPTAAGKTLVAILSIARMLEKSYKAVYIVPLVALAYEKYEQFSNFFKEHKVAISVGDFDSADPWLKDYDIIVATSEKLDSLIRHNVSWIPDIRVIVADEIHLLQDVSRGPTLEILLTRLRECAPSAQIIALSASIKNAKEIAEWLSANLVKSDFRPVKLYEGVSHNYEIKFLEKEGYKLNKDLPVECAIVENTLKQGWQAFFFVSTRKFAESLAEKLNQTTKMYIKPKEKEELEKLSENILNVLETPTEQCKRLAKCVKNGVAFHHAGLVGMQKRLIEENFKKGLIKIICCTPTLAMGISFPADRVIIRDAKRYYPGIGSVYIPVLDYSQMKGRAGRPEWSKFGESILIAKNEEEAQELVDNFILGEPETITSKLSVEPVLRMHTLALIASGFCNSKKSLFNFFSKTFYAHQYGNISLVFDKILEILEELKEWKFVEEKKKKLYATRIGKRVSELYIDPLTAYFFISSVEKKKDLNEFGVLQLISNTVEMKPLISVRTGEYAEVCKIISEREKNFIQKPPKEWELEFEEFIKSVKTALLFESWINETTEEQMLVKYRVTPGELHTRLEIADWLIYSLQELLLLLGKKELLKSVRKLRIRLQYGVKEELIPLVRLRQVGRIRARKLYNAGLTSLEKLRKVSLDALSLIVGAKVAYTIKEQLGQVKKEKEERQVLLKDYRVDKVGDAGI